ncbi:MAG: helix-turn-helix domain-containing protein [Lysobacteraceae bacterium]|nr:MAG: helix-turn-helix domain-containing protein [Xanthomonadaceae bacterium]
MDHTTARRRLQALRERRQVSQVELAKALDFKDRQTLSAIELGKRALAPAELVRAAAFFQVDVDYFTDPLELAGEATFSWRKSNGNEADVASFEQTAGRWIATFRHLARLRGDTVNSSLMRVALTAKSSYEEAVAEGEAISLALGLGAIPASSLVSALEERLDTLVLLVDTIPGISGAACQLGPLNAIIINRREASGRRSFDLGHELFHLLTWSEMKPPHIEAAEGKSGKSFKRIETLADKFSSGLLMPEAAIREYVAGHPLPREVDEAARWIKEGALHFRVSGQALKWRLVGLGLIARTSADQIADHLLRSPMDEALPPRFSRRFVEILAWAIDHGHMSVRRVANVVGTNVDDLADMFSEHGVRAPFDL